MTEARVWQLSGVLAVFVSVAILRSAMIEFDSVASSPLASYADGLWAIARGVASGFLFIIGAAMLIASHVLRVAFGTRHRPIVWIAAAVASALTGIVLLVWKAETVIAQVAASAIPPFWLTNGFPEIVAACFLSQLATLLLLGDRMASRMAKSKAA